MRCVKDSGVARMVLGDETKRRDNSLKVTQKYYEIRPINIDQAFFLCRKQHGLQCQSLCGAEVIRKIKQLEVEGGHVPQCPQLTTPMYMGL